jgi:hypothetical protein
MMPNVVICVCDFQKIQDEAVKAPIYRAALPTWRAPRR